MKEKVRKALLVFAIVALMVATSMLMIGCGGGGASSNSGGGSATADDNAASNSSSGNEVQVVQNLVINDVEFTAGEVDIEPVFGPVDMPKDHKPFEVFMDYTGSGDAKEALSLIYNEGTLMVNGEEVAIGATARSEEGSFVTLISSTAADLSAADLKIVLVFGNQQIEF